MYDTSNNRPTILQSIISLCCYTLDLSILTRSTLKSYITFADTGFKGDNSALNNVTYTLFHEIFSTFFLNKISLPERRNKRKSVLEITKMYYF